MPALGIGTPAPPFAFRGLDGEERTLGDSSTEPTILLFSPANRQGAAPAQLLTFDDEQLLVIGPSAAVASRYGVERRLAAFVVGCDGLIVWRQVTNGSDETPVGSPPPQLSRREFVATTLAASLIAALTARTAGSGGVAQATDASTDRLTIELMVNGRAYQLALDPRVTLLDALREHLALSGTKKGCDHGQCGACTVHVNGRRVLSCLTLAATVSGQSITTIEGLARDGRLDALQQAFIDHDGFQCGYCTPGQIMSAVALLSEPCGPDDDDVRECMSGNICRCGAYAGIVAAVQSVRGTRS
jgi:xanthine dehydrogenase YagT iron-sulfur-binding subunit